MIIVNDGELKIDMVAVVEGRAEQWVEMIFMVSVRTVFLQIFSKLIKFMSNIFDGDEISPFLW